MASGALSAPRPGTAAERRAALHDATAAGDYPPLPDGPFATLVVDPPWMYTYATRRSEVPGTGWMGQGERYYPTMPFEEIAKLPVADLAADDAVLWLWVVNPMLGKGIDLAARWGFQYKGLLTWAKTQKRNRAKPFFGMGYWLRGATEHVVLATRGKPKPLVRNQVSWFSAPIGPHSRKPDEFYAIAERYYGGPRADLFARTERPGWTSWGNDVQPPTTLFGTGATS